jgi:hypothetical protein
VKRHLTPAAVADFGPRVEQLVAQLLADIEAQEQPDLIRDLAYPLPAMVVCQLLGVPTSHLDPLRAWSNRVMRFIENVAEDKVAAAEDANEAVLEMTAFARPLVEERRRSPKDDLISTLVPLVDDGQLSPTALYGWCLLILIAGHETTTGLIGNAVTTFLQHPEAMASLRAEPARIDRAIEEILRFESPVDRQTRLAIEDLELGGKRIPAGSRMYCLLAAANRDPEAFAEPETLDIDRWPNRHLGFGYGIHFCLGAYLARLEARTAVLEVLSRYPNLTLAGTPKRWRGQTMRRYESVPVDLRLEERQA